MLRIIYVFKIELHHIQQYATHLKGLTDDDKISRFGTKVSDHSIDQLMMSIVYNEQDHRLWVAEDIRTDRIVGWGHLARADSNGADWELAVSVDRSHQRKGIGGMLIQSMIGYARVQGFAHVFMHCIESNAVIQHLAVKHDLKTRIREGGERTAAIEIPPPSLTDLLSQWCDQQNHLMQQLVATQQKILAHQLATSAKSRNTAV